MTRYSYQSPPVSLVSSPQQRRIAEDGGPEKQRSPIVLNAISAFTILSRIIYYQ
jgi:hypothetical protein